MGSAVAAGVVAGENRTIGPPQLDPYARAVTSAALIETVKYVLARANDTGVRPDELFGDLQRAFDAAGTAPFQDPAVAIKISGGIVQGTVSNIPCDVLVIDYDCEGDDQDSVAHVPERDGDTDTARMYEERPLVDESYLASLYALKDIVDMPDELHDREQGVYLIEDGDGGKVRCPLTIDGEGRISIGDGLRIGDTDAPTVSAQLILQDCDPVEVDGDWHRDMEEEGLLDDALTLCAQGYSPEAAAEAARELQSAARP